MRAGGAQEIREVRAGEAQEAAVEDFTQSGRFKSRRSSRKRCRTGKTGKKRSVCNTRRKEAGVIDKAVEKVGAVTDKAAGGDGAVLNRAGGARKIREAEEIADNFTEGDEFPEDAAVLERLEKNGVKFFI